MGVTVTVHDVNLRERRGREETQMVSLHDTDLLVVSDVKPGYTKEGEKNPLSVDFPF